MNKQYFAALKQHITTYLLLDRCEEHDGSFQGRLFRIKTRLKNIRLKTSENENLINDILNTVNNFMKGE